MDTRLKFDERLKTGKFTPKKLWSTAKDIYMKDIKKNDPRLGKDIIAIFTQNLGQELKAWEKMVKRGKVDRASFLKADKKIANIISTYDSQLDRLAAGRAKNYDIPITNLREALRAIAKSMSDHTKYIDKKGLWKK